jgi:putative flippase GtrA
VDLAPRALIDQARSPTGQKFLKYSAVSVVSVIIAQVLFIVAFNVFRWTGTQSNMFAVGVSAVPSYYLNRAWAWGKRGRSHWLKEVIPFWALAFLGWVISTIAVALVEQHVHGLHHAVQSVILQLTNIAAFGVLWVVKFIIFNQLLFVHREETNELA